VAALPTPAARIACSNVIKGVPFGRFAPPNPVILPNFLVLDCTIDYSRRIVGIYSIEGASMRFAKTFTASIALLILVGGVGAAVGAPLTSGGLLFPVPQEAQPVGGVVIASSIQPIVSPTYSANLVTTVIQGDTSNPYGGLTFMYEIQGVSGTESINRLSVVGYGNTLVDASYRLPTPGAVPPAFFDREPPGDALGVSFASPPVGPGPVEPGKSSATLVFQTNATTAVPSPAFLIDGATTGVVTLAPIPEPSTLALCGIGALGLGLAYRRYRGKRS
jgi:hypothetical protein